MSYLEDYIYESLKEKCRTKDCSVLFLLGGLKKNILELLEKKGIVNTEIKCESRELLLFYSLVDKEIYYPKFIARDTEARTSYSEEIKKSKSYRDDIFVMDIIRGEIKNNDPRIQRIILK